MSVLKCRKCRKNILFTKKCYHCGSVQGFDTISEIKEHDNAAATFAKVKEYINLGKYDQAVSQASVVIEWMPTSPEIYWLRLLAKNKCNSASELIRHGFNPNADADYYNVCRFSIGEEQKCYQNFGIIVNRLQQSLINTIRGHAYGRVRNSGIVSQEKASHEFFERKRTELFSAWTELNSIEQQMVALEKECDAQTYHVKCSLQSGYDSSVQVKNEVYQYERCSEEEKNGFEAKIQAISDLSDKVAEAYRNSSKNHPKVNIFTELTQKRDAMIQKVRHILTEIQTEERNAQIVIGKVGSIRDSEKKALHATELYNFSVAFNYLEHHEIEKAFRDVG